MKLEKALELYNKVRRPLDDENTYIFVNHDTLFMHYSNGDEVGAIIQLDDIISDDWEEYVEQKSFLEAVKAWTKFRRKNDNTGFFFHFREEGKLTMFSWNIDPDQEGKHIFCVDISKTDLLANDWIEVKD